MAFFLIKSWTWKITSSKTPFHHLLSLPCSSQSTLLHGPAVPSRFYGSAVFMIREDNFWQDHAISAGDSMVRIEKRLQWSKLLRRMEHLESELRCGLSYDDAERVRWEHRVCRVKIEEFRKLQRKIWKHFIVARKFSEISAVLHDSLHLSKDESIRPKLNQANQKFERAFLALLEMNKDTKEREVKALVSDVHDSCSCFIEVQSGAEGTESMEWAAMVINMYKSWVQRRGFGVTVVDEIPGEIAGIKYATIKVNGKFAYGYAKGEVGVHELNRIPPFDSGKRLHTSFAEVSVMPILKTVSRRYHIKQSDLQIESFCARGAGGQHPIVSAVRIVHIPTNLSATCRYQRLQRQNEAMAMEVLQSQLDQLEIASPTQLNAQDMQYLTEISRANRIRTYSFHCRMVKDLRTNYEESNPDLVLDGFLDGFIFSFLSESLDKAKEESI